MLFRIALSSVALLVVACTDPDRSQATEGGQDRSPEQSKRVYRCEMSPLIDFEAEDSFEDIATASWRVVADGLCDDADLYDELTGILAGLPSYTEQDYPFIGYCEHYLIADGTPKALLIGFVCEGHGIVVWEVEADDEGRWMQVSEPTLRGTEEDKAAIRETIGRHGFSAL